MPQTPKSHFQRSLGGRFLYGRVNNYRERRVLTSTPNQLDGVTIAPTSGEAELDVTVTIPAKDAIGPVALNPSTSGTRVSWTGDGIATSNSAKVPQQGGYAVDNGNVKFPLLGTGQGPNVVGTPNIAYPRVSGSAAVQPTPTVDVEYGDGNSDTGVGYGATPSNRYDSAGSYTANMEITDSLGRVIDSQVTTITVSADSTAPSFSAGPTAADGGALDIDMTFTADDNGMVYAVVVPTGDPAPNAAEVKAGTASGGGVAEAAGSTSVTAAAPGTLTLSPTSGSGTYDVYFVLNDGTNDQAGAPTVVANVDVLPNLTTFTATTGGAPLEIDLAFESDTDGQFYYVLVPAGDPTPTPTEVKNGQASGGGAAPYSGSTPITAATPDTSTVNVAIASIFDAYAVVEAGALDSSPATVSAGVVATPTITAGPTGSDAGGSTMDVQATSESVGILYVVVVPNGDPAPTAGEIINGQASGGGAPSGAGNTMLIPPAPGTVAGIATGAGAFDVYAVVTIDGSAEGTSAVGSDINVVIA